MQHLIFTVGFDFVTWFHYVDQDGQELIDIYLLLLPKCGN